MQLAKKAVKRATKEPPPLKLDTTARQLGCVDTSSTHLIHSSLNELLQHVSHLFSLRDILVTNADMDPLFKGLSNEGKTIRQAIRVECVVCNDRACAGSSKV